jgi:hypothetical protein
MLAQVEFNNTSSPDFLMFNASSLQVKYLGPSPINPSEFPALKTGPLIQGLDK